MSTWAIPISGTSSSENLSKGEINERIGLRTEVMDATALGYPDDHFDFICSNNTFEHVYPEVLRGILSEFKRTLKPVGVMSHFIDLSDHFAHLDTSITIYNFLRFSKRQWGSIDNDIQPQNRLRWPDYLKMYAELGIPVAEQGFLAGDAGAINFSKVHAEFGGYPVKELAVSHGYLVS